MSPAQPQAFLASRGLVGANGAAGVWSSLTLARPMAASAALNPRIAAALHTLNPPTTGVPRDQLTIPVCPVPAPSDIVLFEQPGDPNQKLYLPRYHIIDQPPLQITLAQGDQDWTVTARLEKYRAPDIDQAGLTAVELPHSAVVVLRFNLFVGSTVAGVKDLTFQELTPDGNGLRAVLHGSGLAARDQVYRAMTDPVYGAVLLVHRAATVAVPLPDPGAAGAVSAGDGVLHGTWMFSFDTGRETGSAGADVWWDQETKIVRRLVPQGAARLVNLGAVDFDALDLDHLQQLAYGPAPVPGNADGTNQLVSGDVFALHTIGGNYAKVLVLDYGYDLKLRWVTYKPVAPHRQVLFGAAPQLAGPAAVPVAPAALTGLADAPQALASPAAIADAQAAAPASLTGPIDAPAKEAAPASVHLPAMQAASKELAVGSSALSGEAAMVGAQPGGGHVHPPPPPPPPPPPAATLYQPFPFADDERLQPDPLVFPAGSPVFVNVSPTGQDLGLARHDLDWNGRTYSYYQDLSEPWVFYYLPDRFKIARRDDTPHVPALSVQISATDATIEHTSVTLTYAALPFTQPDRLTAAQAALGPFVTASSLPHGVSGPVLQALQVASDSLNFSLSLPVAGSQPRPAATLDLRAGIADSITLGMDAFQGVYAALFSNLAMFRGTLEAKFGPSSIDIEHVGLVGLIADTAGAAPLDISTAPDAASGGLTVTLTAAIESPLRIDRLTAKLTDGSELYDAAVKGATFDQPLQLNPGDSLTVVVAPVAGPIAGAGPLQPLFDFSGVSVQPDAQRVWDSILNPVTPNQYQRTITLEVYQSAFKPPASAPADSALEINVDFKQGHTVQVRPADFTSGQDPVSQTVTIELPIADYVLNTEQSNQYTYRMTTVRPSGSVSTSWATYDSDILTLQ